MDLRNTEQTLLELIRDMYYAALETGKPHLLSVLVFSNGNFSSTISNTNRETEDATGDLGEVSAKKCFENIGQIGEERSSK